MEIKASKLNCNKILKMIKWFKWFSKLVLLQIDKEQLYRQEKIHGGITCQRTDI